ncbi:hypothetical protein GUJ93_ZPchr0002g23662 [Zizania palustris]|uniref:Uncharacterized protein n=1 Tax=Zizania palustris TaxID=103762 RepID=A0A8J5SG13_ZIZPA|nr:hypothetical protein GUJ93_ZPchr0002g23662 [Zizania palustris]
MILLAREPISGEGFELFLGGERTEKGTAMASSGGGGSLRQSDRQGFAPSFTIDAGATCYFSTPKQGAAPSSIYAT